jgi:hypothetical protein
MRIECLSLSLLPEHAMRSECIIKNTESFFLSRRGVLLIRSVLFLSINPSELEKSCSPHFPWLRASVLCLSTGRCSLAGVAQHAAHQQFIIILHCIQCFSDVIGISLSVFVLSNSFPPAATFRSEINLQWQLTHWPRLRTFFSLSLSRSFQL